MSAFFLNAKPCFQIVKFVKIGEILNHKFTKIPCFIQGFPCSMEQLLYHSMIKQQYRLASASHNIQNPFNFDFWEFQISTRIYKITHTFSHEVREQVPIPCWFWPSNLNKDFISSSVQSSIAFCRKSLKTNKSLSNCSPSILCITSLPNDWSPSS